MTPRGNVQRQLKPQTDTPRRPMAFVRQVSLFNREITERLNLAGMEVMLEKAARLSEGRVEVTGLLLPKIVAPRDHSRKLGCGLRRAGIYFGSTMLTIPLPELARVLSDSCDASTAARLARRVADCAPALSAIRAIAQAEAERLAGGGLSRVAVDVRVQAQGDSLLIDTDVEAEIVEADTGIEMGGREGR